MTSDITPLFGQRPSTRPAPEPQAAKAGETIDYQVTYLEMTSPPKFGVPPVPGMAPTMLLRAQDPPVDYFLSLYDAVGRDHEWQDMHQMEDEERDALISDPAIEIFTFFRNGWTHGFFMLDFREAQVVDLAYFGLVPAAVGCGLSGFLLKSAILEGWGRTGVECMTVNTCTLDHPRALAQYQRHGFVPIRQEARRRTLTRDWNPSRFR